MITKIVILVFFLLVPSSAYGSTEFVRYNLGIVTDLTSDENIIYFFETDRSIKSPTWIQDTKVKTFDGNIMQDLSGKLFIHPTELKQNKEYLFFATLSEGCIGQITCDYQDLIQMSKRDGSITILAKDLRSSIHISLENNVIYVSESDGKIWKINFDGSKKLVTRAQNIVMGLASDRNDVYWIEEVSDQNSTILGIKEGLEPRIIASDLKIPYDITVQNGELYWNEIQILSTSGTFADFTFIKTSKNDKVETLMEFQNTSPITKRLGTPHYGPYLVAGDYLFLVNNTNSESRVHMLSIHNKVQYDIAKISDYNIKYLRSDDAFLYTIGKNSDGFVIGKYALPVTVPEFPSGIMFVPAVLFFIVILQRFWHVEFS